MKKLFFMLIMGTAMIALTSCDDATTPPGGIVRLCEPIAENQYLLLYDNVSKEENQPVSEEKNTFYLYDSQKDTFQYVVSGKDLWDGPGYHLSATDSNILYQAESGRLFQIKHDKQWTLSEQTKSETDPYVISPDGTKYVIRQNDVVKVYDLEQDAFVTQTDRVTGVLAMEWSDDNSHIAMVMNGGTGAAVWDIGKNELFVYDAVQDENTPAQWVDIVRAHVIGDEQILLIDYLCESGVAFVFWDIAKDQFSNKIEVIGDATILDIFNDTLLYEVKLESGLHTLNVYQCSSKENTVLDQYAGFYTAGCICNQGKQSFVFRYDTKNKTGELVQVRVSPEFCVKSKLSANSARMIQGGSRGILLPPFQQHNADGARCQERRSRSLYP